VQADQPSWLEFAAWPLIVFSRSVIEQWAILGHGHYVGVAAGPDVLRQPAHERPSRFELARTRSPQAFW
jgi:hypothetical protein